MVVCVCVHSASSISEAEGALGSPVKNKHIEDDGSVEAEQHEVKRLKFDKDEAEETGDEDDVNDEPVASESAGLPPAGSSSERPESSSDVCGEDADSRAADMLVSEDQGTACVSVWASAEYSKSLVLNFRRFFKNLTFNLTIFL